MSFHLLYILLEQMRFVNETLSSGQNVERALSHLVLSLREAASPDIEVKPQHY